MKEAASANLHFYTTVELSASLAFPSDFSLFCKTGSVGLQGGNKWIEEKRTQNRGKEESRKQNSKKEEKMSDNISEKGKTGRGAKQKKERREGNKIVKK